MTPDLHRGELALTKLLETTEAAAWASIAHAAPATFGLQIEVTGDYTALLGPKLDWIHFNRVLGLGLRRPVTSDILNHLTARYRQAGVTQFGVQLSPQAQPDTLLAWLKAAGFRQIDDWAKLVRRAEPVRPPATRLEIVSASVDLATVVSRLVGEGFGLPEETWPLFAAIVGQPGWLHYLALDGPTPIATGALYHSGKTAWLGATATLPPFRRQGAQAALVARRLHDAAAQGCRWLVTETGRDSPTAPNTSYRNLVRQGFRLAYHRLTFVSPVAPS